MNKENRFDLEKIGFCGGRFAGAADMTTDFVIFQFLSKRVI